VQSLRDQFYVDLNQRETNTGAPARDKRAAAEQGEVVPSTARQKHEFKLREKAEYEFFASDDEDRRNGK